MSFPSSTAKGDVGNGRRPVRREVCNSGKRDEEVGSLPGRHNQVGTPA